jgi:hypothetical protein
MALESRQEGYRITLDGEQFGKRLIRIVLAKA